MFCFTKIYLLSLIYKWKLKNQLQNLYLLNKKPQLLNLKKKNI